MTMRLTIKLLILLGIVVLFVANIQGLTEVWPQSGVTINSNIDANYKTPMLTKIVSDGEDGAIISWTNIKVSNNLTYTVHYIQRVSQRGDLLWGPGGIKLPKGEEYSNANTPRMLPAGNGSAYVVYTYYRKRQKGPPAADIQVSKYGSNGEPLWGLEGKTVSTDNTWTVNQYPLQLINSGDGIIIIWRRSLSIVARKIDFNGNFLWGSEIPTTDNPSEQILASSSPSKQITPQTVIDNEGGFVLLWHSINPNGSFSLVAQRVNKDGQLPWGSSGLAIDAKLLEKQSTAQYQITKDSSGNFIITWIRKSMSNNNIVFAKKINKQGATVWETKVLEETLPEHAYISLSAVSDFNGGIYIVWDYAGTAGETYAQRILEDGKLAASPVKIANNIRELGIEPVSDKSGFFIAYTADRPYPYIQKITPDGLLKFGLTGRKLSSNFYAINLPEIEGDGKGGVFAGWREGNSIVIKKLADTDVPVVKSLNVRDFMRSKFTISAKFEEPDSWVENQAFFINGLFAASKSAGAGGFYTSFNKGSHKVGFTYKFNTKKKNGTKHKIAFNLTDAAGNRLVYRKQFKIDNTKPKTFAPKPAKAKRNQRVKILWKVTDKYSGNKAYVTIKIKRGRRVVKTISSKKPFRINKLRYSLFRARLKAGTYYFYVYAKDLAGNKQQKVSKNRLIVL